jgi:hypothetical protein
MKVDPGAPVRSSVFRASARPYLALVVGFVLSAVVTCSIWRSLGDALGLAGGSGTTAIVAASVLVVLAALERAPVRRSLLVRQTPATLHQHFGVVAGGFGWGLDTGTMVSTYRTSFATWATLGLCFAGFGGAWSGLAYGVGFCLPLGTAIFADVLLRRPAGADTDGFVMRIASHRRTMHLVTAALMLVTASLILFT